MMQLKIFEQGGVLPDGFSLDNYFFVEVAGKLDINSLPENVQNALNEMKGNTKLSTIKLSYPKATESYFKLIKNYNVKSVCEDVDVLVTIEQLSSYSSQTSAEAVNILKEYLKIKNNMSEEILPKETLERIKPILPNIVYDEIIRYSVGGEKPVVEEVIVEKPVVEETIVEKPVEPKKEVSIDDKIKGYQIRLKLAQGEDKKKIESKIKGYEIRKKALSKKENGGELTFTSSVADPPSFKKGGGFKILARKVAHEYEGKKVPLPYQKEYGKTYSKSEAKEVGQKVAAKIKMLKLKNQ